MEYVMTAARACAAARHPARELLSEFVSDSLARVLKGGIGPAPWQGASAFAEGALGLAEPFRRFEALARKAEDAAGTYAAQGQVHRAAVTETAPTFGGAPDAVLAKGGDRFEGLCACSVEYRTSVTIRRYCAAHGRGR